MQASKSLDKQERWIGNYSFLFIVCFLLAFWQIAFYKRSFINEHDGLREVYSLLIYKGEYLRHFLYNIFYKHTFDLPHFDLNLGMGGDLVGSLGFYGFTDVLNLFSVFFVPKYVEVLYTILVFVRLYLAGIFFFLFCKHHNRKTKNILLGAVIYVFSYWTIETAACHPYFLNPLMYFPLILLGIDHVLEKNKPVLFICSCTLAAYASVYFFYMSSIFVFVYALVRYIFLYGRSEGTIHFVKKFSIGFLSFAFAFLLALPVVIPFARVVLSGNRVGRTVPALWEPLYYIKFPIAFVNASADHYASMGYTVIGLIAVIILFFKTKCTYKLELKIYTILGIVFLVFPFFGHVFNGLGYATNRWTWAFNLLVSVIVVDFAPFFFSLDKKKLAFISLLVLLFALPTFAVRSHGKSSYIAMAVVLMFVCAVFVFLFFYQKQTVLVFSIVAVSIFLSAFCHFSPYFFNYVSQTMLAGSSFETMQNSQYSIFEESKIDVDRQYRLDIADSEACSMGNNAAQNYGLYYNRPNTALYYSTNDGTVRQLLRDFQLPVNSDLYYTGLNGRAFVDAYLGCRYCAVKKDKREYLPFGFEKKLASNENFDLYENETVLPLVFSYSDYMPRGGYQALSSVQKQQAVLQTAFITGTPRLNIKEKTSALIFDDKPLAFAISDISKDIAFDGKLFDVKKGGACVTISVKPDCAGELYLIFDNLYFSNNLRKNWNSARITVKCKGLYRFFDIREKSDQMYSNIHDFIFNLGFIDRAEDDMNIEISFSEKGIYSFDDFSVTCQPVTKIPEYISALTADNISYHYMDGKMYISGDIVSDKILCISAPFQDGSYALIDGKKQKCFCVNNFATGIEVSQGFHEIEVCF